MRKNDSPHELFFEMEEENIVHNYCTCMAGNGKCIHLIGLMNQIQHWILMGLSEIPEAATCTSREQVWHKPRGLQIESEKVMKIVVARPNSKRKGRPLTCSFSSVVAAPTLAEIVSFQRGTKQLRRDVPLSYIISTTEASQMVETPAGMVPKGSTLEHQLQDFVQPDELPDAFCTASELATPSSEAEVNFPDLPLQRINSSCKAMDSLLLTLDEAVELEIKTRCHDTKVWYDARKPRLTASTFSSICKRKKRVNTTFLFNMFDGPNLSHVGAVQYGKKNETTAKKWYISEMKRQKKIIFLFSSGFVVNTGAPFLGCSPDGKVFDPNETPKHGLMEIKCPLSKRGLSVADACSDPKFYCTEANGNIVLKENSKEFYQVQGQMLVTGLEWCDFVVFNGETVWMQRIKKDTIFCDEMLRTLEIFYLQHWQPFLQHIQEP